ncbi:MAG: hypothetical protein ACYSWU_20315 [Planctomycetota bacterium]|jgi:hypothetical protein
MNPAAGTPSIYELITEIGMLILMGLMILTVVMYVHFKDLESDSVGSKRARWGNWPILVPCAAFYLLCGAAYWHGYSRVVGVGLACCGLAMLIFVAYAVRQDRSQWSIKALLQITFLVAASCGLLKWQGWRMVPILMGSLFLTALFQTVAVRHRARRKTQ